MKLQLKNLVFALLVLGGAMSPAVFAQGAASTGVIFENVRIFDGTVDRLSGPSNVLTVGNVITAISGAPIPDPPGVNVTRIQGGGRTLMPGLIDNHWHTMFASPTMSQLIEGDLGYLTLLAVPQAEATLMRGFTTVRDLGGPSFALKRAIDEGLVVGPRIYPSGAMITITGGHGDFRSAHELPRTLGGPLTIAEQLNASQLADSPDEVRMRTREQLLLGASQIKLTAGGGVASPHSPLDASTFTEEELRAAVQAAGNWGTYVGVHAYTPEAIQRSIAAGVKVIEHGHLMDDASCQADRRERPLAELPAFRRRRLHPADAAFQHGAVAADHRGHRAHGRAGQEVQDQDGMGHRHPVFRDQRDPPGRDARHDGEVVQPGARYW